MERWRARALTIVMSSPTPPRFATRCGRGGSAPAARIGRGAGAAVPETADLYLLGGGEDRPQTLAARELRASGAVNRAHAAGAVVFAVCAGYQIIGESFP